MTVTIYHNPRCGTSRDTLALIREAGVDPVVIEYLKEPPPRAQLQRMIAESGLSAREALRAKEPIYAELGLGDTSLSDAQLLDAMLANPILINRPFVTAPGGTRLCRPAALVHEILAA
jgi:arsenate reductase (glutaredoxin)